MSVVSPPRPPAPRAVPRQLVEEQPLRYPDTGVARVHDPPRLVARPPQLPDPGLGAGRSPGNRRLGRIGLGATLAMWVAR